MPIYQITSTELVQRCANCGATHHVPITLLRAGVLPGAQYDERIVALPPCDCRAVEFLIRSDARTHCLADQGTFTHLHCLLVDHLHNELVRRANESTVPDPSAARSEAPPKLDDELATWFPDGLQMPLHLSGPEILKKEPQP